MQFALDLIQLVIQMEVVVQLLPQKKKKKVMMEKMMMEKMMMEKMMVVPIVPMPMSLPLLLPSC
jgi:hypothetical protein